MGTGLYQILKDRGWQLWDKKNVDHKGRQLLLCPLKDLENVPDGTTLECIDGSECTKGKDYIDDNVRGGFLSYGVRVSPED